MIQRLKWQTEWLTASLNFSPAQVLILLDLA